MADFDIAMTGITQAEGGWSNDPADSGGETIFGIARKFYPDWQGWKLVDQRKTKEEKEKTLAIPAMYQMVMDFYRQHYWNRFRGGAIPDSLQIIANELLDEAVNFGVHFAVTNLQCALNALNRNGQSYDDIDEDGVFGLETTFALNWYMSKAEREIRTLYNVMNILQGARYIEIMRKNKSQERFARGWLSRVTMERIA